MPDRRPYCSRDLPDGTGCDYSRYDIHLFGPLCSRQPLSISMALTVGNLALQLPSLDLTTYNICVINVDRGVMIAEVALILFYG